VLKDNQQDVRPHGIVDADRTGEMKDAIRAFKQLWPSVSKVFLVNVYELVPEKRKSGSS